MDTDFISWVWLSAVTIIMLGLFVWAAHHEKPIKFPSVREPFDDGEGDLPRRLDYSELGYEEALHLVKIERTEGERRAYIEDLLERGQISQSLALSLVAWTQLNPLK